MQISNQKTIAVIAAWSKLLWIMKAYVVSQAGKRLLFIDTVAKFADFNILDRDLKSATSGTGQTDNMFKSQ